MKQIAIGKATFEYAFQKRMAREPAEGPGPMTPRVDPVTVSKRAWDRMVREWRRSIHEEYESQVERLIHQGVLVGVPCI